MDPRADARDFSEAGFTSHAAGRDGPPAGDDVVGNETMQDIPAGLHLPSSQTCSGEDGWVAVDAWRQGGQWQRRNDDHGDTLRDAVIRFDLVCRAADHARYRVRGA